MTKRQTKRLDVVQNAKRVIDEALARVESPKVQAGPSRAMISQVMAAMGRKGGKIGGKRRLETMTPTQRKASAKAAIKARWDKYRAEHNA